MLPDTTGNLRAWWLSAALSCNRPRSDSDPTDCVAPVAATGNGRRHGSLALTPLTCKQPWRRTVPWYPSSLWCQPQKRLPVRPGLHLAVRYGLTILLFIELIKRLRILTLTLLPLEVDRESINDPTSRIITPNVISAYTEAAGNLVEAVCVPSLGRCVNILSPVNCVVSYPTASFVPVVTSWSKPTVTLQTMERIVDEVSWLYISSVCHLTSCSHRMRGPREKDCPQFPIGKDTCHHVLALQASSARW